MRIKAITNAGACLFFASLLILGGFQSAYAGGFQLGVQATPSDYTHVKDAVLLVRTYGCHTPADANVTATAEGIVNGRRTSIPLELLPDEKGVYAITQQWQSEGTWVLSFTLCSGLRALFSPAPPCLPETGPLPRCRRPVCRDATLPAPLCPSKTSTRILCRLGSAYDS